jgi:hypothetical protein
MPLCYAVEDRMASPELWQIEAGVFFWEHIKTSGLPYYKGECWQVGRCGFQRVFASPPVVRCHEIVMRL